MNRTRTTLRAAMCASLLAMTLPPSVFCQPSTGPYRSQYTLDTNPFAPDYKLDWPDYDWSLGDEETGNGQSSNYQATWEKRLSRTGARLLSGEEETDSQGRSGRRYFSSPSNRQGGVSPRRYWQPASPPDPRQTLSGRVIEFQKLRIYGPRGERIIHDAARVRLEQGGTAMVDLRRISRPMKDRLLESGQVMALGRSMRINGRRVFRADRLLVNDRVYEVAPRNNSLEYFTQLRPAGHESSGLAGEQLFRGD